MEQERGTEEKDMIGGRLAKEMTGAGKGKKVSNGGSVESK